MKLLSILKVILKEQEGIGSYSFMLNKSQIVDGIVSDFVKSPIIKNILHRNSVNDASFNDALAHLIYGSSVDDVIEDLKLEMISKTELDQLKKDLNLFSKSFNVNDYFYFTKVISAIYKALEGDDSDLSNLSGTEIDTYLKYYTSDKMNSKYGMKNDPRYKELVTILKSLKNKSN